MSVYVRPRCGSVEHDGTPPRVPAVRPRVTRPTPSSRRSTRSCGRPCAASSTPRCARTWTNGSGPGRFPDSLFRRCGELGFLGLHYPARFGGSDGDLAAGLVFVEELARCGAGAIPMAISVQSAHGHARARPLRHRRPARPLARARDHRREDRRHRDHRARRGLRRRRDPDARRPRRRRLAHQRPQDVHHQRRARATSSRSSSKTDPDGGHRGDLAVHRRHVAARRFGVARSSRSSACTRPTPPRSRSTTWRCRTPTSIGLEPGQGFAQLMWQLQYERLAGAAASVGHATQVLAETDRVRARAARPSAGRSPSTR